MYSHIKAEQGKIRFLSQILQHLYRNADYLYIVGIEIFHRIVFRVQAETLMLFVTEHTLQCGGTFIVAFILYLHDRYLPIVASGLSAHYDQIAFVYAYIHH